VEEYRTPLTVAEKLIGIICIMLFIFGGVMYFITKSPPKERPPISESNTHKKSDPIDFEEFEKNFYERLRKTVDSRVKKADKKREEVIKKYLGTTKFKMKTTPPSGAIPEDMFDGLEGY
jgi:phosphorylcholine metabolism protein LicD